MLISFVEAFEKVVATIGEQNMWLTDLRYNNGHAFIKTFQTMVAAFFNVFISNYAAEANNFIHAD